MSPDGRWLIYESDESGKQFEIFLRAFPDVTASREKISVEGGAIDMMAASASLSPSLKLGAVTKLFGWQKPPP